MGEIFDILLAGLVNRRLKIKKWTILVDGVFYRNTAF